MTRDIKSNLCSLCYTLVPPPNPLCPRLSLFFLLLSFVPSFSSASSFALPRLYPLSFVWLVSRPTSHHLHDLESASSPLSALILLLFSYPGPGNHGHSSRRTEKKERTKRKSHLSLLRFFLCPFFSAGVFLGCIPLERGEQVIEAVVVEKGITPTVPRNAVRAIVLPP